MSYLKSPDFPLHLMAYWWLVWIGLSLSPLNEFLAPSWATIGQLLLLVASFVLGHITMKCFRPFDTTTAATLAHGLQLDATRLRWTLGLTLFGCLAMLTISLKMAGALDSSFLEYFAGMRLKLAEGGTPTLTGVRALDVLTKVLAFPLSYTVLTMLLAVELTTSAKRLLLICLTNILCFAYLWQVNYPFIHMFWFIAFYTLLAAQRKGIFNKRILAMATLLFAGLMASAANRFGGDILGGFQRYIVGYHLIGFSYYDHQYLDPHSVLHTHSFGRSSLGFLDQVLEALLKPLSLGYRAASFENAESNETTIDIGAHASMEFNAFGTILFSLYRDFHLIGVLLGGFTYGSIATLARYRSARSWRAGALFFMLSAAWMMGMMVNPLEEVYFWFTIITIGLMSITNRGLRW